MSWLSYADRDGGEFAYINYSGGIIDNSVIVKDGLTIDSYVATGGFLEFGNVTASELTLVLDNSDDWFDIAKGFELTVNIDADRGANRATPTAENRKMGVFIVDKITKYKNRIEIVALDRLIKLDQEYEWDARSMTLGTAVATVETQCGVPFAQSVMSFPFSEIPLIATFPCSCRELISYVAEVWGMGVRMNKNGELEFGWYWDATQSAIPVDATLDPSVRVDGQLSDIPYVIKKLEVGSAEDSQISIEQVEGVWEVTMRFRPTNPVVEQLIATGDIDTIVERLDTYLPLKNTPFWGMDATALPYPDIQPYMIIDYVVNETTYRVPITHLTYSLNRNMKLRSVFDSENLATNSSVNTSQKRVNKEVDDLKKHFFFIDGSGVHITEIPNDFTTGNNVMVDSDSVDVRRGTITVASFGENTQIGEDDNTHIEMDFNSLRLVDKEGNGYFVVEDLRNEQGIAQIVDTFEGDGTTRMFKFTLPAENTNYTVTVDGAIAEPEKHLSFILFNIAPAESAEIVVAYETSSPHAKARTFGSRKQGSRVGSTSSAEGDDVIASGAVSHAEGVGTEATGNSSHAEGFWSIASGEGAHAEGMGSIASGTGSHAQNEGTIASGHWQTALGKFNVEDTTKAVIIGNGTQDNRSNAVAIDWNGDVTIAGNYKLGKKNRGVRGLDTTDYEYPLICDNGTNLWIGANATASKHHTGRTFISTGYDTANSKGFETIAVSVPNATNTEATNYGVWHKGNLPVKEQFAANGKVYDAVSIPTASWTGACSFVLPVGTYIINASGRFNANTTGVRGMMLSTTQSSSTGYGNQFYDSKNALASGVTPLSICSPIAVSEQTTLWVNVYQNSGGNLSFTPRVSAIRIL